MRSIEFALKMGKKIYVFPQRLGESEATNQLLKEGRAEAIYSVEDFVSKFATVDSLNVVTDDFLLYCQTNPTYDEALQKYPQRVFEAELSGEIKVLNAVLYLT
jgi:DNA processing protein